jgi:cell division transport system permease protein
MTSRFSIEGKDWQGKMISRLGYTLKQAFRQIYRNRAMSLASIFAITAMLLILGLFFILIINVNMAAESVKSDYNTIEVWLDDKTGDDETQGMVAEISKWDDVTTVDFRSKEEALSILKERWGESGYLLDGLQKNPLPNSIVITVSDLEKSSAVATKAEALDGIEGVKYYKDTVDKLIRITNGMQLAALVIMIFLVIVSVVVVANTIKLTVFARSEEITIMKYVGATNWFIRGPFLAEGIVIGIISAVISAGVVGFIYDRIQNVVGTEMVTILSAPLVPTSFMVSNLFWIFIALGISIGSWGSIVSMRKFLDT